MREVALTRSARFSGDAGKILVTAFLLFVFLCGANAQQQSANNSKKSEPPSGIISGHVYSAATGAALAKAVVTLQFQENGGTPATGDIETSSDGSFQFAGVAAGKYQVLVDRCGYLLQTDSGNGPNVGGLGSGISLGPGEKRDGINFYLVRGGVISGTVTDGDDEPVPGLQVEARAYPYAPGGGYTATLGAISTTYTDDLGNFRLIDLNTGSYFVVVGDDEAPTTSSGSLEYREVYFPDAHSLRDALRIRVTVGSETTGIHVTVKLERAFTVRGRAHGACPGGPNVSCAMFASNIGSITTDNNAHQGSEQNGVFEIPGLFSGEYALTATAVREAQGEGYRYLGVGTARVQVMDRDAEADVSVEPLAEVSGTVTYESSRQSNQGNLQLSLLQIGAAFMRHSGPRMFGSNTVPPSPAPTTSHFRIPTIEPGSYIFTLAALHLFSVDGSGSPVADAGASDINVIYLKEAICGGRDYAKEVLEIGVGARLVDCKIKIGSDTATINGKVMDGDKGVAGQIVVAIPESPELRRNPRYTLSGRTNRDGQFSIVGIIPGDYLIFAVTPNVEQSYYALDFAERNPAAAERATFKPGEAKTFVLKASTAQ